MYLKESYASAIFPSVSIEYLVNAYNVHLRHTSGTTF